MPLEEHMGEVSWESSEKFKESYSQDVSLNRELMTKINKQRDLFCPWAGGVPFLGRRPWSWDTVVLAGLFQDELPSWRHQQEGPSTFAPRRATPRECRRSSSSSSYSDSKYYSTTCFSDWWMHSSTSLQRGCTTAEYPWPDFLEHQYYYKIWKKQS
ncbi:uncharacterized protein LOC131409835 isoform X1 [Diceros bicornis minor]|uniref:uncharacterized protein LOC131409835 isoform X1 n=1 Tax=Diceros bicornis minor TaxID=77932 RepID=UPI0026EDEE7F|nr:uncharacterized protein LOC131409835 isoform X1 [Diceros bicornis minor]